MRVRFSFCVTCVRMWRCWCVLIQPVCTMGQRLWWLCCLQIKVIFSAATATAAAMVGKPLVLSLAHRARVECIRWNGKSEHALRALVFYAHVSAIQNTHCANILLVFYPATIISHIHPDTIRSTKPNSKNATRAQQIHTNTRNYTLWTCMRARRWNASSKDSFVNSGVSA